MLGLGCRRYGACSGCNQPPSGVAACSSGLDGRSLPLPTLPLPERSKSVGRHASIWFSLCRPAQGSPSLIYPEAPASSQKSCGLWIIAVEQVAGGDQGVRLYGQVPTFPTCLLGSSDVHPNSRASWPGKPPFRLPGTAPRVCPLKEVT